MKTIKVLPNPFCAKDREGVPCGVCPRDPDSDGGGPGLYVGAEVDAKATKVLQKLAPGDDMRSARQHTVFSYLGIPGNDPRLGELLAEKTPIEVPATKYYKDRVREGALIACDAESAKAARAPFVAVAQALGRKTAKARTPEVKADEPTPEVKADEPVAAQQTKNRSR